MKNIALKIISVICAICIMLTNAAAVFAAGNAPELLIQMDSSEKIADISIKNVGMTVYSFQITLKMNSSNMDYTLRCTDDKMYGTTTSENGKVVLYIDSTEMLNGNEEIKLAQLISDSEMTIGSSADLILVDYSMKASEYKDVKVSVSRRTVNDNNSGSSGNVVVSGGGSESGTIASGSFYHPNTVNGNAAGKRVFYDVADDHWAKASIDYVVERGLFDGTSDYTFEPSQNMTRAMYVVVLSRFGSKIGPEWQINCDTPASFDDIPSGEWYSDAVAWAGGTGLVSGVGDNCFAPNQPVTREQMAVMTVNFAKLCGVELPSNVEETQFADEENIQYWASDAVHAAQRAGIISGRDDNIFAPQDTATRAEVAAIMNRLVKILNQ